MIKLQRSLTAVFVAIAAIGMLNLQMGAKAQPTVDTPWSSPELVKGYAGFHTEPQVAVDASGNAYVLWSEWNDDLADGRDIFLRRRTPDGTWHSIERISGDAIGTQLNPGLAVDSSGKLYTSWVSASYLYSKYSINFRLRDANGNWGPLEKVTDEDAWPVLLTIDGMGRAYVVWEDEESSQAKLRVRSSDGSWGSIEVISSYRPRGTAVDAANNLYVLLDEGNGDSFLRRRSATGEWEAVETISDLMAAAIDVDDVGNVYVLLEEKTYYQYYLGFRPVGGTWQKEVFIGKVRIYGGSGTFDLDNNGNGYFAWTSDRDGDHIIDPDVYTAYRWQDGSVGSASIIQDGCCGAESIDIAIGPASDLYYLVWDEDENIYFSTAPKLTDTADLSDSRKRVVPGGVREGEVVQYIFEVNNSGKTTDFVLSDTIPTSTTLVPNSSWYDAGLFTLSGNDITWTGVSTHGATIRAGFAVTVNSSAGTGTRRIPYVLANMAELSFGTDQHIQLTATVVVNPLRLYLPLAIRGQ